MRYFNNLSRYYSLILIFVLMIVFKITVAQTVLMSIGESQTSTPFRTSEIVDSGNKLLAVPKIGWVSQVGVEYAQKPKSSFYSSLSIYQSGANLEDYEVIGQDPYFLFDLENDEYTYTSVSLNTNYNMQIWRSGSFNLSGLIGLHLDRILYRSDIEVDYRHNRPSADPLEMLTRFDALNKTNFGYNIGGKMDYQKERFVYSLNYILAPRFFKMGSYDKPYDEGVNRGINGISVQEKVSFITLGIGYKLKNGNE